MRRTLVSAATAASIAALIVPLLGHATTATPAQRAISYLVTQLAPDWQAAPAGGGFVEPGATEDTVMDAVAAGINPNTLKRAGDTKSAQDYLDALAPTNIIAGGARTAKYALSEIATEATHPAAVGIAATAVATLDCTPGTTGCQKHADGTYDTGSIYSLALPILALVADGKSADVDTKTIAALQSHQVAGSGFEFSSGTGADTNSTAIAIQALRAAHRIDSAHLTSALGYLRSAQDADGGFPYQAGSGSDADSTAGVVQAIVSAGQDPRSAAWSLTGNNAVSYLLAQQDAGTGGFGFQGSPPDSFTTSLVPYGLLGAAFPVTAASTLPAPLMPTPSPAATPAATPAASAIPTPVTSPRPSATAAVAGAAVIGAPATGGGPEAPQVPAESSALVSRLTVLGVAVLAGVSCLGVRRTRRRT